MKPTFKAVWRRFEDVICLVAMAILALIPFSDILVRKLFATGIPSSSAYLANTVLVLSFLAAMMTSRDGRHLSISSDSLLSGVQARNVLRLVNGFISCTVATALFWSSVSLFFLGFDPQQLVGFIPVRVFVAMMPLGFLVMAVRFATEAKLPGKYRALIVPGFLAGSFLAVPSIANAWSAAFGPVPQFFDAVLSGWTWFQQHLSLPCIILLVVSGFMGTPVFILLGGLAYALFSRSGGSLEVIPSEAYTMLTDTSIPAIPLFTMAGYILAESRAGERLVGLFKAAFGWIPGGIAIAAVIVSTFFTTFTGATGVTIVALGSLLAVILTESGGHSEAFSHGLITASASIGLLFMPSLVLIIYGTMARISVVDMFLGSILPGLLLVVAMSVMGVVAAVRHRVPTVPFEPARLWSSLRLSFWEILIPVIIIAGYFTGLMTLIETAAFTAIYCAVVETLIKKDIRIRDLPRVLLSSAPIIGGVLVILACARGLAYYIIDAEVPMNIASWVQTFVHSRIVFLLFLNLVLLVTGCFMDIFSAIMVVAPLIIPIGKVFGIEPVHLGIIFIANLGLGYMTPPVGLNLFLASYTFRRPLGRIYRDVLPFFLVQLVIVLLVTYVPWLTTAFVRH